MTPTVTKNRTVTEKQKSVLEFIGQYMAKFSYPPTIRDIALNFGITPHAAYYHLTALKTKGLLDWRDGKSRTIRILKKGAFGLDNLQSSTTDLRGAAGPAGTPPKRRAK